MNEVTRPGEVDALLRQLLDGVRERLGPRFIGMCPFGALDGRWHELIRQALARPGVPLPDDLEDTLDFIRHTSEAGETFPAGLD
ncbi:MAG: hypothetical protein LC795_04430 [Acidobacteria bacterium]|nr:hypothetical protein [Acidobacteriota bacterium]